MRDFIWLFQLGVGWIAVRYDEITYMETLISGATKVHISLGQPIIVEQSQYQILCLIDARQRLNESLSNSEE